jgi:hypothetical protein
MIQSKFLRLKALMISEDGGTTWVIVRQFYLTDDQNTFLDTLLQGKRLKMTNGENLNENQKNNPNGV